MRLTTLIITVVLATATSGCFAEDSQTHEQNIAVWVGDFEVTTARDLQRLTTFTKVQGSVFLRDASSGDVTDDSSLRAIEGHLIIEDGDATSAAGLDNVEHIWGDILIRDNRTLEHVAQLEGITLAGSIEVSDNPALQGIVMSNVDALAYVRVTNNAMLDFLDFARLEGVGGDLEISGNAALTSLELPELSHVSGDIVITNNPRLPTCAARKLAERLVAAGFTGNVTISGNNDAAACAR